MLIRFIYILILTVIYHISVSSTEHSVVGTEVYVRPKINTYTRDDFITMSTSRRPTDLPSTSRTTTNRPQIGSPSAYAFPLSDSDCFCSYDQLINLLLCSPLLRNSPSHSLSDTNTSLINITLNDCTFSNSHLTLPMNLRRNIDQLRLYNVNHENYLVLDGNSFVSYSVNHLYMIYSYSQPITMILMSNETFSSSSINLSLRTLYITSCYLITLNKPLNRLFLLQSVTLINIYRFSWYDFQQQIIRLPKLRFVYVAEDIFPLASDIFNAISCQDISSQWTFTYRSIQTCSCTYVSFLQTVRGLEHAYKCPNSDNTIDFTTGICQFKGKEYEVQDQTNLFCNKCLSYRCPSGTVCSEVFDSEPMCMPLSRYDYETIRQRIPFTPYTRQFLLRESQEYLAFSPNKTLEPNGFNSIATILIDSNRNRAPHSLNDAQMFHQTFFEMLNRPWSPDVYSTASASPAVWQQLFVSLDESIQNINDSESKFVFQSQPISTMSVRFPSEQQTQDIISWKITNDNQITENITNAESIDKNVTSRVFLKVKNKQQYKPNCNTSNPIGNCTNRFSITSLKSPKLFYNTDRIPQYDVISILAPDQNQSVTFYFDQKISSTDILDYSINTTNLTSDPFYDQLDQMISQGTCMYLNTASMIWQTDGCFTDRQSSNSTSVTCTCEHLTMFTVFFSLSCTTPSKAFEILSWIGCALSIVGLSMTLIMFIVISQRRETTHLVNGISSSHSDSGQDLRRKMMSKPRRWSMVKSMLFILCILLILMNILIFILTFIKSGRNLTCTILSASLYYFTLTAFLWKFCFALQQSLFITNIFQPYWSDRTLFIIYFLVTFLLPLCPLIFMFSKYENSTFISSTCNYCWLTREFLLYGLVIPILVLICLNTMFYLYTMIHLCLKNRRQPGLRSTKSDHSRHMQNFKIGLFFAIVMGLSWILGFLVLIPNSYVRTIGNILFCVVNTLQGFAFSIMVFCMLERKSFRKCCCFCRYQTPANDTVKSTNAILQLSLPIPHDDNDAKIKTIYNLSIDTASTTYDGENHPGELSDQFHTKKVPIAKERDEDEHIYSSPTF